MENRLTGQIAALRTAIRSGIIVAVTKARENHERTALPNRSDVTLATGRPPDTGTKAEVIAPTGILAIVSVGGFRIVVAARTIPVVGTVAIVLGNLGGGIVVSGHLRLRERLSVASDTCRVTRFSLPQGQNIKYFHGRG